MAALSHLPGQARGIDMIVRYYATIRELTGESE